MAKVAVVPPEFRAAHERLKFSPGVISGGYLFLTGVTGGGADEEMPDEAETQFRQVFAKMGLVLREAGLTFDSVVEMTSYHVGLHDHFDLFDAIRLEHVEAPYPAWTAVEVAGLVAVMASNLRWCSDVLEVRCWNGEVVCIAFLIDAVDREVIAHVAVTGAGISGSDIRDMMLAGVERRFGTDRAPPPIEHLSNNGSCYTAKDTRDFAQALGLLPCFTPVRSPGSNGMSKAFVKTLRRDYVRVTPLPGAATVFGLVSAWIADYNTVHPHSALAMHSPREFHAALNPSRTVR